jgi:dethiobiotin synthetase
MNGIFITGTDTGIGKTFVTAYLTGILQRSGVKAVPYKPIQSGGRRENGELIAEDIEIYQQAAQLPYRQEELCTYCLEPPVSPHLAARISGVEIEKDRMIHHYHKLQKENEVVIVEGAGGLAVPLAENEDGVYLTKDFIKELNIPIIIVTHPFLGTINHSILTAEYAMKNGISVLGFVVNKMPRADSLMEQDNLRMLKLLSGVPVIGKIPYLDGQTDFERLFTEESLISLNQIVKKQRHNQ